MSQPKRYDCTESWGMDECMAWMDERVDGRYVEYSDYAALAAENERLRSKLSFSQRISEICKQTHEGETITVTGSISSGKTDLSSLCQCERLTSEIDRLRKAGDDLAVAWARVRTDYHTWDTAVKAWDVAKEGGRK